jgi:hypothetical protein
VDPLVVPGGVGEPVDLVLVDKMPAAVAEVLADVAGQVGQLENGGGVGTGHGYPRNG